jgi:hypothetical protein
MDDFKADILLLLCKAFPLKEFIFLSAFKPIFKD